MDFKVFVLVVRAAPDDDYQPAAAPDDFMDRLLLQLAMALD